MNLYEADSEIERTYERLMSKVSVRASELKDIDAIQRIYANEVLHGLASFEVTPPDATELSKRRTKLINAGYPHLIAELNGETVGYAYAGPYRTRSAYKHSVENSVYVDGNHRGLGIGKQLLQALIVECEKGPWRQMIAIVGDSSNTGSLKVHKSVGFRLVGTIEAVGYKHDTWVDTVILQRSLNAGASTNPSE